MREREEPHVRARQFEPMQGGEKRKRTLVLAELAVNPEIGQSWCKALRKVAPERIVQVAALCELSPQPIKLEPRPFRREQILRQRVSAAGGNPAGIDAAFNRPARDRTCRDD